MQEVGAPEESMIKELALSWGIEQEYTDNWGENLSNYFGY